MANIKLRNCTKVEQGGVAPGKTVTIAVDKHGSPIDKYWRRRMRDAEHDNAFAVAPVKRESKSKQKAGD